MAVKSIAAFFVLLFALASCQAKPENCSEARCKLLSVGEGFASEFRLRASEKGVRIVYLNLKIGNDTYHPLKSENEFLPERWVWANSISEPMLSLPYDYGILSLGLLNYQVRSLDLPLEDQPSGCLASLNSSCQNKVVGRALLNVTQNNPGELLHERDVVCVSIIAENTLRDYFFSIFVEGNVKYQCCRKSKEGSTEESSIQCEIDVQSSAWFKAFDVSLNILTIVMVLYCPAFLLLLPDFIFNLKEECRKEEQREILQQQDNQPRPQNSRYGPDESTSHSIPLRRLGENETTGNLQSQPENSQKRENKSTKQSFVYLDEPNPITFSDFFGNYTKKCSDLFPFNVKLAFLCYCVIPIFVYIELGLNYTIQKKLFEETKRKGNARLHGILFTVDITSSMGIFSALTPLIMILLSYPKDFLLPDGGTGIFRRCIICHNYTSTAGEDMLKHFEKLQIEIYDSASWLIKAHMKGLEKSLEFCTHRCLKKISSPKKRMKQSIIILWVLLCNVILVTFLGVFLGGIYLGLFMAWLGLLSLLYSPLLSLGIVSLRLINKLLLRNYQWFRRSNRVFFFFCFFLQTCVVLYQLFTTIYSLGVCFAVGRSSQVVTKMVGFIILGSILNSEIVSPIVTFFFVALTNIYLCYYNLQKRYQDVKRMIFQKWQTSGRQIEQGAIPADLFWHICSVNSKPEVLPVGREIYRMLCHMALILTFLVLVFCSIFLVNAYDISAVASTIAVFISGVIPGLFFKGLTKEKRFTGSTRTRMMKNIEEAVNEYIQNTTESPVDKDPGRSRQRSWSI